MFTDQLTRPTKARTFELCLSSPTFPGMLPPINTYAAWPVWSDSTTAEVRWQPMPKREAVKLWHEARRFERQTRQPNHQDGALGRNGLAIVHALLFDFINYKTGALYPSWEALAEAANISARSVGRGLAKLKEAGVLHWLRRCVEAVAPAGGFLLRQISNAYHVCSTANWKGYKPPPPPPPPDPACWGAMPPQDPFAEAAADRAARLAALEAEARAGSFLSAVLARELRKRMGADSSTNSEAASLAMKPISPSILKMNGRA
jgi:hypothetical protein